MTLPATPPITAQDINVELGRSPTAAFDITGAEERALAGVPSGAISFTDFLGKSAVELSLTPATVVDGSESAGTTIISLATSQSSGTSARAGVRVRANGTIEAISGITSGLVYTQFNTATDWVIPNSAGGSDYTVNCTQSSGNTMGGDSLSTNLSLGSNREFYVDVPGQTSGSYAIRSAAGTLTITGPDGSVDIGFEFEAENDRE
jgi:hypothetical protein